LTTSSSRHWPGYHENLLEAISVGFFLLLVGFLFITNANLYGDLVKFVTNIKVESVSRSNIYLPIPQGLANYESIYVVAREFSLIWGIFLIALIGARLILGSATRRLAQNLGDIAFWLGAAYLIQLFLVTPTQAGTIDSRTWLAFWALIIMLIGISLLVRACFLAANSLRRPRKI
jgi:hypothetical protein